MSGINNFVCENRDKFLKTIDELVSFPQDDVTVFYGKNSIKALTRKEIEQGVGKDLTRMNVDMIVDLSYEVMNHGSKVEKWKLNQSLSKLNTKLRKKERDSKIPILFSRATSAIWNLFHARGLHSTVALLKSQTRWLERFGGCTHVLKKLNRLKDKFYVEIGEKSGEIKSVEHDYRRWALKNHPDKTNDKSDKAEEIAKKKFQKIGNSKGAFVEYTQKYDIDLKYWNKRVRG